MAVASRSGHVSLRRLVLRARWAMRAVVPSTVQVDQCALAAQFAVTLMLIRLADPQEAGIYLRLLHVQHRGISTNSAFIKKGFGSLQGTFTTQSCQKFCQAQLPLYCRIFADVVMVAVSYYVIIYKNKIFSWQNFHVYSMLNYTKGSSSHHSGQKGM